MKMLAPHNRFWLHALCLLAWLACLAGTAPARAATALERPAGHLVAATWLQQHLGHPELVVLDTSPRTGSAAGRIPGAVAAELFSFGPREPTPAQLQQLLQSWGVGAGRMLVIVDQGGSYQATRLFWDLLHHGVPPQDLFILDGGMAKWQASGGALSRNAAARPAMGSLLLGPPDPTVRVRLPEFLAATADPGDNVLLEALDPDYFYGGAAFFNRGGHVPHATLMPSDDFFNEDKTFKSPAEIARMLAYLGVRSDQQVLTYCGGGGAAAVPFFALRFLLGYPRVKMFAESQMGWLQDPRELPVWTYAAPRLLRDTAWVKAWASPMLKSFGLATVSVIDLRPAADFRLGHLPLAVNLPALAAAPGSHDPQALNAGLAAAGVEPAHELLLVSEGGLNERSALAFMALERLGRSRVSIYLDSLERWSEQGLEVVRPAAAEPVGQPTAMPSAVPAGPRSLRTAGPAGLFAAVTVTVGPKPARGMAAGPSLHLPFDRLLHADGRPRPAAEIWRAIEQAGVPRYARVRVHAETPGSAAMGYVLFKLMGWPDVQIAEDGS